ncbi:hypothetical protein ACFOD9_11185 [Novosphingobium bradum]|uniref:Elongation factor P n=1 Tax=Novosphingobium bradum TaxID=1737444 RepID=A0ABV7IQ69_9SPHN
MAFPIPSRGISLTGALAGILAGALLAGTPAVAAPGGAIGTLPLGTYHCELPGDAEGAAGVPQPERDFTVIHGSSYAMPAGTGVYLLTGDRVEFTSGPLRGAVFSRSGRSFLREALADGREGALRCVRAPNSGR